MAHTTPIESTQAGRSYQARIDRIKAALDREEARKQLEIQTEAAFGVPAREPRAREGAGFRELGAKSIRRGFGPDFGGTRPSRKGISPSEKALGRGSLELTAGVLATLPVPQAKAGAGFLRMLLASFGEFSGSFGAETFDPTPDPLATAKGAAVRGVVGQGVGEVLTKIGSKLVRPSESLIPGAKRTAEIIAKGGGRTLPGLISDNRTLDLMQGIADASFFGGATVKRIKQEAIGIVDRAVFDFVGKFRSLGGTKLDTSEVIQDIVKGGITAFGAEARSIARVIDNLSPDPIVNYGAVLSLARKLLRESEAGLGSASSLVKKVIKKEGNVTFEDAQILRSELLSVGRTSGPGIFDPKAAATAAKRLAGVVDAAMEKAARGLGTKRVLKAWRDLNAFWKSGADEFNSSLMKTIVDSDPDVVFDTLIKAGKPSNIVRLRNIIVKTEVGFRPKTRTGKPASLIAAAGRSKRWEAIQGEFFRRALSKATKDNVLLGNKLVDAIDGFGPAASRELFPVGIKLDDFREFAIALRTSQRAAQETTGRVFVQLKQAGAIGQFGGLILGATGAIGMFPAAMIIIGPAMLGKLFANKTFAKAMTFGLKAPAGSAQMVRALSQAIAVASQFGEINPNFTLGGS